jgi:hypothetical protein
MLGGMYTWSNNQEVPILEKLDKILMSILKIGRTFSPICGLGNYLGRFQTITL